MYSGLVLQLSVSKELRNFPSISRVLCLPCRSVALFRSSLSAAYIRSRQANADTAERFQLIALS